jgi:VCBS repeat-containing protein
VTGSVATNDSDPDQGAVLTYTLNAPVAGLTLNSNGTYSFDPANAAYNSLAAGQTRQVVANYTVTDAQGATATSTLTFTVTGTNDVPVAVADTAAGNEGAGTLTGSVATNDSDPDNDTLTFALTGTAPAGLTFNSNGGFTFDANNAAYNSLAAGATQVVTVPYTVTDPDGATASSTLTITVTGTNDAPVATAVTGPAATEGGAAVTATVVGTDPDQGAVLTYSLVNPVAGVTINATTGVVTLNPADPAFNSLAVGQVQAVVANVRVTDAQGLSTTAAVTFNVTGTNDAPVAVADTAAGLEDAIIAGNVGTNDSDPDAGAVLTYTVVGTAPAGFTLNSATGAFALDTNNAAYQDLREGEVRNVVINYQVADANGGTATSTLTIAVTGRADTANLDVDSDNNLNTRQVFDGAATGFDFTDDDDVANTVVINNFGGADDIITFDAPFNGAGRVSFANVDFDGDGIANDLQITTNKGGVVSDIVLRNVVADANSVVFDEATAEAAVGAGFDNFRTTTQSAVPTGASLDVDSDGNLTSRFTLPVAANTGTFAYTDDASFGNTVRVNDFGSDDTLTFNSAVANVSFTSGDFDNDGVADDLRITTNNGGVVSDIVLANSVAANAVVTSAASAEAAIGAGVTNFIFNGTVIAPPAPPPAGNTVQSLDADNDGNINTARVFDAGTDGFRFTDDADVANTVIILNLGNNDRIILETGNLYSFTNGAQDADGIPNDLIVTLNKGGVVSEIVIKDVVDPNAFVSNEAQAEAALGGIDYFQFA